MAYTGLKPADTQTIAQGPADIRAELQGLATGQVVDAGTLKGLSPGNASGQIPVSNGTMNTNFNAEKVGGKYASDFSLSTHTHSAATTSTNGLMSNTDKTKLDGIAAGAEVNQMAFSAVLVGSTTIQADAKTDTLEMVAGTNIALTPDATNDRVTIGVTGTVAAASTAAVCTGNAATATAFQTARTIATSGDAVGTATSFNGSANITIPLTLAASGATAGTYTSVTVDAKGRVTSGSNPATISANTTGNAATATALQTARNINGVPFNGGADITIPVGGFGVQGSFKNLKIANGTTANSQVVVTADQVVLFDASNLAVLTVNPSVTISTGTTGANGRDTGSLAASTWYAVWLIYNGTTVAGLLSTSATAPTMPSGYTYKARLGWVRTDSSGNLYRTLQQGRKASYVVTASSNTSQYPQMTNSAAGSFTAIATAAFVPTTACEIGIIGYTTSGYEIQVAPNASHVSPAVPFSVTAYGPGIVAWDAGWIVLESGNIYYKVTAGTPFLWCSGWVDNL